MILGYVDVEDRIYDLNFATLRLRVRLETGEGKSETRVAFSQVAGYTRLSQASAGQSPDTRTHSRCLISWPSVWASLDQTLDLVPYGLEVAQARPQRACTASD